VDAKTMRELVESARVAHLSTVSADGHPHVVPICFALVDQVAYTAVDDKPKRSTRLRRIDNLTATRHACLLVDHYSEDWTSLWWVRLDGHGRVVDDPHEHARGLAALREKYQQYAERPPTGPVLALDVDRWSGWSPAG
jgi:PPOX class probable F420-dependent enzyme